MKSRTALGTILALLCAAPVKNQQIEKAEIDHLRNVNAEGGKDDDVGNTASGKSSKTEVNGVTSGARSVVTNQNVGQGQAVVEENKGDGSGQMEATHAVSAVNSAPATKEAQSDTLMAVQTDVKEEDQSSEPYLEQDKKNLDGRHQVQLSRTTQATPAMPRDKVVIQSTTPKPAGEWTKEGGIVQSAQPPDTTADVGTAQGQTTGAIYQNRKSSQSSGTGERIMDEDRNLGGMWLDTVSMLIGFTAIASSICLQISPLPLVLQQKHIGRFSQPSMYSITLISNLICLVYGIITLNTLVVLPSMSGTLIALWCVWTVHIYTKRMEQKKTFYYTAVSIFFLMGLFGVILLLLDFNSCLAILGLAGSVSTIMQYGAPLVLLPNILKERSAASLPVGPVISGFAGASMWMTYGVLRHDSFIVVTNGLGAIIGGIQVMFIALFPTRRRDFESLEDDGDAYPESFISSMQKQKLAATYPSIPVKPSRFPAVNKLGMQHEKLISKSQMAGDGREPNPAVLPSVPTQH